MVEIIFVKLTDDVPFNIELIKHISFERRVRILKYRNEADKKRSLIAELLIRKAAHEKLMIPIDKVEISYNPYGSLISLMLESLNLMYPIQVLTW